MGLGIVVHLVVKPFVMFRDRATECPEKIDTDIRIIVLIDNNRRSGVKGHDMTETLAHARGSDDFSDRRRDIDAFFSLRSSNLDPSLAHEGASVTPLSSKYTQPMGESTMGIQ